MFVCLSVRLYVGEFDIFRFYFDTGPSLRPKSRYKINFDWFEVTSVLFLRFFLKFSQMLVIKAMKNQDLSFNLIFILLEIQYF